MALTDYSDLEKEILNAPEPKVLPAGSEVKARIIAVQSGENDDGFIWHRVVFDVPNDPLVLEFNKFMNDLKDRDKMEEKNYVRTRDLFSKFVQCFDIDLSRPFDWGADLPGKEGWVILGIKKSEEFGDQNTVRKFIVKK